MSSMTKMASLASQGQLIKVSARAIQNQLRATSGIGVATQVRMLHSDMEVPDFSYYRRSSTKDSTVKSKDTHDR